jgi:hypothetical protein
LNSINNGKLYGRVLSSNIKTLEVLTVYTYPSSGPPYKGYFILHLTHDINEVNELTTRMRSVGPKNEMLEYDEVVFQDLAKRKYKAKDLWLVGQNTDNQFKDEADGSARARGDFIFYFACNDFFETEV